MHGTDESLTGEGLTSVQGNGHRKLLRLFRALKATNISEEIAFFLFA